MWSLNSTEHLLNYWNKFAELGEMMGSFILTFSVLIILFIAKEKKFGIDSNLKKRIFLGSFVPIAVVFSVVATSGFGGHGQINPAVTLLVGAITGNFYEVPAIIGFQLIGAIIAASVFLLTMLGFQRINSLPEMFKFSNQSVKKTVGMEVVGNIFWFLPVGAFVVALLVKQNITILHLALAAGFGKVILVGAFEEFGAGNFNAQIWFGKMIVTFFAQKGKITKQELASELSGLGTTLVMGFVAGVIAHPFAVHADELNTKLLFFK